ncbi:hypothetical protein D3C76_1235620 [compost metagenome]
MVAMPVDLATTQGATFDDNPIRGRLTLDAQRLQAISHGLDTVGFFHPQLLSTAQYGLAFCAGRGDEQHREFINGQRHQGCRDFDTLERCSAHMQVRHRLATDFARVQQSDISPHQAQDIQHTGASRVDTHMLEHQVRTLGDGCCHQEKRRRGDIAGHFDASRTKTMAGLDRGARP